jgi:hypothetical protein
LAAARRRSPSTPNNETIMRKFLAFPALALAFGLTACDDNSTSSDSSWTGDASIVGNWKEISSQIGTDDTIYDTVVVTFRSGGTFSYLTYERIVESNASTLDTLSGTENWSTSGNRLYLVRSGETDSSIYSINGTKLTLISLTDDDTEVLTRQ